MAEFGRIDALVVNHGVVMYAPWEQQTDEFWDATIETNLSAPWRVVKAVIPHMVAQGSGSIVFTASFAAVKPAHGLSAYSASKAGVMGLMGVLASELAPHGIRVNAVLPGSTATPMMLNQHTLDLFNGGPGGTVEGIKFPSQATMLLPIPWLEPEDISHGVLFLVSDESRHVTGIPLPIDGGMLAQPPGIPPIAAERLGSLEARLAEHGG